MKLSIVISICALLYFSGHTLATSRRRIRVDCHQFKSYGSHCPEEYKPLCGSDGVTYANDCKYCAACREKGRSILVRHRGECKEKKPERPAPLSVDCRRHRSYCTEEYKPLCGSDGVTYANDCKYCAACREKGRSILVRHRGECKEKKPQRPAPEPLSVDCRRHRSYCTEEYKPLCGSDGVTYANDCKYCAACREKGRKILVSHRGACKGGGQQQQQEWRH